MRPARLVTAAAALALLGACGQQQMSRATAERLCEDEARLADGIGGSVGVGVGSGGGAASGRLTVTSDILNPRTEAEALEACVARRLSGDRTPSRPRSGLTIALERSFETGF